MRGTTAVVIALQALICVLILLTLSVFRQCQKSPPTVVANLLFSRRQKQQLSSLPLANNFPQGESDVREVFGADRRLHLFDLCPRGPHLAQAALSFGRHVIAVSPDHQRLLRLNHSLTTPPGRRLRLLLRRLDVPGAADDPHAPLLRLADLPRPPGPALVRLCLSHALEPLLTDPFWASVPLLVIEDDSGADGPRSQVQQEIAWELRRRIYFLAARTLTANGYRAFASPLQASTPLGVPVGTSGRWPARVWWRRGPPLSV